MFKINNNVVLMSLLLILKIFTLFPGISIVDFEQVNVCWKTSPNRYPQPSRKIRMWDVNNIKHHWN